MCRAVVGRVHYPCYTRGVWPFSGGRRVVSVGRSGVYGVLQRFGRLVFSAGGAATPAERFRFSVAPVLRCSGAEEGRDWSDRAKKVARLPVLTVAPCWMCGITAELGWTPLMAPASSIQSGGRVLNCAGLHEWPRPSLYRVGPEPPNPLTDTLEGTLGCDVSEHTRPGTSPHVTTCPLEGWSSTSRVGRLHCTGYGGGDNTDSRYVDGGARRGVRRGAGGERGEERGVERPWGREGAALAA